MTLARAKRTFSIMGRDEDAADSDLSKFFYPPMQAADIFELEIDIALGGMDQRKAHMYMREVADRWGWPKATCVHTPILSGLKTVGGRMESFDHKMSKSDPTGALLLHDDAPTMCKKLRSAYLDPAESDSPVYELLEHIVFPQFGSITITPNPKYGEPSTWTELSGLRSAVTTGNIHPLDLKNAVGEAVADSLAGLADHFATTPELLESVNQITIRKSELTYW